jgi:predicted Zn finger-like uncharacterized protein
MATQIICPACGTRYETQAVFPPEGRKVRCSRCSHVWQAKPVAAEAAAPPTPQPQPQSAVPPKPAALQPAPAPVTPPMTPPPQPVAPAANAAMRGFAGIAATPPPPALTQEAVEADLAAQVARMNAEAMAEAPPEPVSSGGGIFARLARKARPVTPPPPDASLGDGMMPDASTGDATMSDVGMGDASIDTTMGDAAMGDAELGIDPALAAQAFGEEKPAGKKFSPVAIGWLVLALVVGGIVGTLALAPSAVMSVLPGASRVYAMFGMQVSAHGLALEGVRYGWTSDGGQTVLEVQGAVVNLTSAALDVPTVVIALRDEKGEEISEWTTEIGEEELGAGERAPFLRQIPSPPSNVRSVKVRFAKAE